MLNAEPDKESVETETESAQALRLESFVEGLDGLSWGYRFSKTNAMKLLTGAAISEALKDRDAWVWLNFDLTNLNSKTSIATLPDLPPGALAALLSRDEMQHIARFGQVIGGVLADCESGDPPNDNGPIRWNFAMAPQLMVSAQRHPSHALNQVRVDIKSERRQSDVLGLFAALIHEIALETLRIFSEIGAKLNEMEEQLLDQKDVGPDALGHARRRLVRARRQVVPLRNALSHLQNEYPTWFKVDGIAVCQRVAAQIDGLVDDLDSLQERAHTLQDELKAREAERTTRRLTVLATVSALLLPPTFISGIFSMNVVGLPFQQTAYGFWVACGLMGVSVAGMIVVLRRIRLI